LQLATVAAAASAAVVVVVVVAAAAIGSSKRHLKLHFVFGFWIFLGNCQSNICFILSLDYFFFWEGRCCCYCYCCLDIIWKSKFSK